MKRSRLIMFALTIALTLSALATTPAVAGETQGPPASNVGWICEDGCWSWDIDNGCTQEVTCCANGDTGNWFCILWN